MQKKDNENVIVNQIVAKPYRLQVNDVVSISIKALDQKLVAMFNSSESNIATKTDIGLYFEGYTVDDHGNIRIPVLGEVSVIGSTIDEVRKTVEKNCQKNILIKRLIFLLLLN
ncbi:polysaccharide biosynthesis/export family protein [Flavobacterium myungsuense]|uniref:polysaccharide biosynthesis/export family protein n=1 Tax=Flavobacterium myungsuense TaxID=651823 RepID=UPI00362B095F